MKAIGKNRKLLLGALACAFAVSAGAAIGGATVQAQAATQTDFISSAYVTLNEDIVVKYKLTVPEGYTTATAKYTYQGKEYTDTQTVTAGENVLAFSEVTPVNIGENVAVSVTLSGEGKADITDAVETFSVAGYCQTLLNSAPSSWELETDAQFDSMRALAANLVAYSGALQEYVGKENTAMGNLVTVAQNAIVKQSVPTETDLAFSTGNESDKVSWAGANLLLDSRVSMAFYFYCTENLESVTLDITKSDGQTVTVNKFTEAGTGTTSGKTVYCGVWEGVSVVDFDKTFTAQLKLNGAPIGNSVTYSVKSYVYSMQKSTNDQMKSLSVALYNYGVAAREYIDALAQDTTKNIETSTTVSFDPVSSATDPKISASTNKVVGWTAFTKGYTASLTTDGEYFYTLAYGGATKDEATQKWYTSFRIVKIDKNFQVLGSSADFAGPATGGDQWGGYEYNTPLWVKDKYAYSYNGEGNTVRVAIDALTTGGVALEVCESANEVAFGGITDVTTINAVDYVAAKDAFVVISGQNTLSVYAGSDLSSRVATTSINSAKWRLATDENALYLTTSYNGGYDPDIYVYDWSLNKIGSMKVGVTADTLGGTAYTEKSKLEGIAVKDDKVYLSLITWQGGSYTLISETTFQKTTNLSFGEIALSDYAYTTSAESVSNGYFSPSGSFIYNIIEKNGYLYIASGGSYGTLRITRYNPAIKASVAQTAAFTVGGKGTENVAMFACGGNLYVYTSEGWKSVPLDFAANAAWTAVNPLPINLGSDSNPQAEKNKTNFINIWYWEEEQKTVLYRSDNWVVLLDKDGNEVRSWLLSSGSVPRFGGDDAGYVYFTANAQGTVNPVVTIIDLRSYDKTTLSLPSAAENGSESKIESVFGYNGSVYFSVLQWSGTNGSNIQKVSYANVTTAQAAPSVDLGEAVELAAKNSVSLTLEKESTITVNGLSTTVKGVVSDGKYFYLACRSSAAETFLVKMTKNGTIIGKTAAFSGKGEAYQDTTYLLYQGGYVYAYGASNDASVYRIAADAFTSDGTAQVENATLPFTAGSAVSAAAQEKASGRYAVRSGNSLILIGADGKVYKTVEWAVGGTPCGVVCDEHYIYLMYENNGGIAFNVFDWNGNKVGTFSQSGLISETTDANIPSMWIEDGKIYIFAKPWGSTSMYLYTVTLSSLAFTAERGE